MMRPPRRGILEETANLSVIHEVVHTALSRKTRQSVGRISRGCETYASNVMFQSCTQSPAFGWQDGCVEKQVPRQDRIYMGSYKIEYICLLLFLLPLSKQIASLLVVNSDLSLR